MSSPSGSTPNLPVELPRSETHAVVRMGRRLLLALGLVTFVALLAYFGRAGYEDADGDPVSLLDAFYYATVSITTTGYGDVRPVSDGARLMTTLLVTPARILFLILLVGTTLEVLAERTREAYALRRWRNRLHDHVIICGFGTKGKAAVKTICARGTDASQIVVIDEDPEARSHAVAAGLSAIAGDATRTETLEQAGIGSATALIVAPNRDDAAVLITLTARELNPGLTIVAAVREEENGHLLRQSGADSVITSSSAAGRMLGIAMREPRLVDVLEDLLSSGEGLDIVERELTAEDVRGDAGVDEPVIAVIRDGRLLRFDDPAARSPEAGDRLVCVRSQPGTDAGAASPDR